MSGKKKKRPQLSTKAATLNIMPFIDIFSMLNTFLLVSASFYNLGILKVQVPYFSDMTPDKSKPTRSFEVKVDVDKENAKLTTSYSEAPRDEKTTPFPLTKEGMLSLHKELLAARQQNPDTDKVTVFSEDDVTYDQLIEVIDSIKSLAPDDPKIPVTDEATGEQKPSEFLYEKVVIGSVVL